MDPITAVILASIIGYAVASPDPVTLGVTRGSAGAIGSMIGSAGRSINADRKAVAARRSKARQDRLDLLRKVRDNPKAKPKDRADARAELQRAAARDALAAGIGSIGRAIRSGFRSMPAGYRESSQKARAKRDQRKAQKQARRLGFPDSVPTPEPQQTPADSGGKDTTSTEETNMADWTRIPSTELHRVADLRSEVGDAEALAEGLVAQVTDLAAWATGLVERYAAADWGTTALTAAVGQVSESAPDPKVFTAVTDALTALRKAMDEAEAVGDTAAAVGAEGKVENFQPA